MSAFRSRRRKSRATLSQGRAKPVPSGGKHLELALHRLRQGDYSGAERLCRKVLGNNQCDPQAHFVLGLVMQQQGDVDHAIEHLSEAVILRAADPEYHYRLGVVLHLAGQVNKAMEQYQAAIRLQPRHVEAHDNLGITLLQSGRIDAAIDAHQRALHLHPDHATSHNNLAAAYRRRGFIEHSVRHFERAIELEPEELPKARMNLGRLYLRIRRTKQAEVQLREALKRQPDNPDILCGLANVLRAQGRLDEAEALLRALLQRVPDNPMLLDSLAETLNRQGRLDDALPLRRRAVELCPPHASYNTNLLLNLHYAAVNAEAIFEAHQRWAQQVEATTQPYTAHDSSIRVGRIRVGYVSADLRNHPVGFFMAPVLEGHDRQRFEIYVYANNLVRDTQSDRLHASVDHWLQVNGLDDSELAARIHADGIQILVDLGGHTGDNRLPVFAYRPAPIQVTWLGYPDTTGLTRMDFRLTDALADPPGVADALHSETLVRLENGFHCFQPSPDSPPARIPVAGAAPIIFGSFNNIAKVGAGLIDLWADILRQVPDSRMHIKVMGLKDRGTATRIQTEFKERGVDPERIKVIGGTYSHNEHLALYHRMDIALDTYPYHGTTTTFDALWMGVPVVTLRGDRHAARVGCSILTGIGHPELIADDAPDYVARAVALARDRERLASLHESLRKTLLSSAFCDSEGFTRSLEQVYVRILADWQPSLSSDAEKPTAASTGTDSPGGWLEYVQDLPYARLLRSRWLAWLEANQGSSDWAAYQAVLDLFGSAMQVQGPSREQCLEAARGGLASILAQWTDFPLLLTWVRLCNELGDKTGALTGLQQLRGDLEGQARVSLGIPFLAPAKDFDTGPADGDIGRWVMEAVFSEHARLTGAESRDSLEPIRLLHNLARSGGTLISKCLGCMENVALLSKIHPDGVTRFNPLHQASEWFALFSPDEVASMGPVEGIPFADLLAAVHGRCMERGRHLLVLDWAHLDFTAAPFVPVPSYSLQTADLLMGRFRLARAALVRHPIDQWQSLQRQTSIKGKLPVDVFLYGYRRFAEHSVGMGFVRYEDFVAEPEAQMQRLCSMLELPYDAGFMTRWVDYTHIADDTNDSRGGPRMIQALPRRPVDPDLQRRFEDNPDYRLAVELLGYG